jgi:hypothetical protein
MQHADAYTILYPVQHWFRKLRLCEPQLIEFIVDVNKNIEDCKQTDILIMNLS